MAVTAGLGALAGGVWFEATKVCGVAVGTGAGCEATFLEWTFSSTVGLPLAVGVGLVIGAIVGTLLFTSRKRWPK